MPSKNCLPFFKSMSDSDKFLQYITDCEYDSVQKLLKNDIDLIAKKGKLRDRSGREFDNISAFEYALWTLNKDMWTTMIACIPQNEKRKKIFATINLQYDKVNIEGITYRLDDKTITERHFDFENTIIKELQKHVDLINKPKPEKSYAIYMHWATIDEQWKKGVGGAQRLLPMRFVNEYCSNEPFCTKPGVHLPPKSLKESYSWIADKGESWFDDYSLLGSEFAVYKGDTFGPGIFIDRVSRNTDLWRADLDLSYFKSLYQMMNQDFINLKSNLEEQINLGNSRFILT